MSTDTSNLTPSAAKRKRTAVDAKRGTIFWMDPNELVIVGIDTKDDESHPLYDVDAVRHMKTDDGMVASIKSDGVRTPVDATKEKGRVLVVAGRRRVLNSRVANAELVKEGSSPHLIPVLVQPGDASELVGRMITENEIRMATSLMDKARKAAKLRVLGKETSEIAVKFNVAPNTVRTWFTLLEADPKIHRAVEKGVIAESAAAQFATLPREKQVEALDKAVEEAKAEGKKVTHNKARAVSNVAAGREENVGIKSRKTIKALRDLCEGEGDENKEGRTYLDGVKDALTLVLGDKRPKCEHGVSLKKLLNEASKSKKDDE